MKQQSSLPQRRQGQKILLYACPPCKYEEVADNKCVYRNEVHHTPEECTQILQDMAADPTRSRTKSVICEKCNHRGAVYYQPKPTARREEGLRLTFVCCNPNCGHRWRVNDIEFLRFR
ncbi:hypothetical protein CXB51_025323 [Gossypium anomalum]|uniref:TFIIS-type domain-containing protein n=1 Tax=Gossypium anomalum TaxID=47600 RepID=A0A8J6CUX0_9ROSI|nr:hypothetical protein CXB51_025323 [Gossypium anomalum]